MTNTVNERKEACNAIIEIIENEKNCDTVLHALFNDKQLSKQQKAKINQLVYGTVERKIELDYVINQFAKVKTNKMKPYVRNVLRMSVYQLLYMHSAKSFAVCDEAVKLVVKRGFGGLRGFVNGVLRTIERQKDAIKYPSPDSNFVQYAAVVYSMPEWIVSLWVKQYGAEKTEQMLKFFYEDKSLTIRVNESKCATNELRQKLIDAGVKVSDGSIFPFALHLKEYTQVDELPGFNDGLFAVQDESSMAVSWCANIKPGMTVIDCCSAPGGKAMHAADLLKGTGKIYARDLTPYKIEKIKENCLRMKVDQIDIKCHDARKEDPSLIESADVVIIDAPCSGLGVIGKKADIKYGASEEKCKQLQSLQREILATACKYVKPGGILMYSTCTVNTLENEDNFEWIPKNLPQYDAVALDEFLPGKICSQTTKKGYLQLLPGEFGTDGFFIAKFIKRN